jgi:hypothetical protein
VLSDLVPAIEQDADLRAELHAGRDRGAGMDEHGGAVTPSLQTMQECIGSVPNVVAFEALGVEGDASRDHATTSR